MSSSAIKARMWDLVHPVITTRGSHNNLDANSVLARACIIPIVYEKWFVWVGLSVSYTHHYLSIRGSIIHELDCVTVTVWVVNLDYVIGVSALLLERLLVNLNHCVFNNRRDLALDSFITSLVVLVHDVIRFSNATSSDTCYRGRCGPATQATFCALANARHKVTTFCVAW